MQDSALEETLHKMSAKSAEDKKKATNPNVVARDIRGIYDIIYTQETFFVYKKGRYKEMSETDLKVIVKEILRDDFRLNKYREIKESLICDCFKEESEINIDAVLNVKNGILNHNLELIKHTPTIFSTIQLDVKYDKTAKCAKWINFLHEMLGDDTQKIQILQEYLGYCLDYRTNNEKVLFMVGNGANGKSVVTDVVKTVFGEDSYSVVSLDDFKKPSYLAMLFGKLVNISVESNAKAEVCESMIKRIASGEAVTVDRKYQHPFSFRPLCKQIYSINNLPQVSDKTSAYFRRIIAIPFNHTVDEGKRIFKLGEQIGGEEGPGVLNWMLEGLIRLKTSGFSRSGQVDELLDVYKRENNNVLDFVTEECELGGGAFVESNEIYEAYTRYCKSNGVKPLKKRLLLKEICENFPIVNRDRTMASRGLSGISINIYDKSHDD